MCKVIVVGSINMDIINLVEKHPRVGETVLGLHMEYSPGGKGANQAVADARAGGQVTLFGAVGNDSFGDPLRQTIFEFGVEANYIADKEGSSGLAFITVDANGENHIILSPGANGRLSVEDLGSLKDALGDADIVLLQNEIPWEVNRFVITEASRQGVAVLLNPAPAFQIPKEVLPLIAVLVLNESEAEHMTGVPVSDQSRAEQAALRILEDGVHSVIITLGDQGSLFMSGNGEKIFTPAFKVAVKDTTAAGDTFIGAFAVAKSMHQPIVDCLRFATAAAAITVTQEGALPSIPSRDEIEAFNM